MLGSLVLFLGIMEAGLRIMNPFESKSFDMVFNPKLGLVWETTDHGVWASSCLHVKNIHTNSLGLRDKEHELKSNRKRIMVFGDSFLEGFTVPDQDLFARQLEAKTGAEVINIARSGWGTSQMLGAWEAVAKDYHPDVVLLGFLQFNDLQDSYNQVVNPDMPAVFSSVHMAQKEGRFELVKPELRNMTLGSSGLHLSKYLYLFKFLKLVKDRFQGGAPPAPEAPESSKAAGPAESPTSPQELLADDYFGYRPVQGFHAKVWDYQRDLFKAFDEAVKANGGKLVVMTIPDNIDQLPDPEPYMKQMAKPAYKDLPLDLEGAHFHFLDILKTMNIPAMDLIPDFKSKPEELHNQAPKYSLDCDNHWNNQGHAHAADLAAQWLRTNSLLEN